MGPVVAPDLRSVLGKMPVSLFDAFFSQGVKLPLRVDADNIGSVLDGEGRELLVVDHDSNMADANVTMLAGLLVGLVNASAEASVNVTRPLAPLDEANRDARLDMWLAERTVQGVAYWTDARHVYDAFAAFAKPRPGTLSPLSFATMMAARGLFPSPRAGRTAGTSRGFQLSVRSN